MGSEYTKMSVFDITVVLEGQVLLKSRECLGVAHRRVSTGEKDKRKTYSPTIISSCNPFVRISVFNSRPFPTL